MIINLVSYSIYRYRRVCCISVSKRCLVSKSSWKLPMQVYVRIYWTKLSNWWVFLRLKVLLGTRTFILPSFEIFKIISVPKYRLAFVLFYLDINECAVSPCKNGATCQNIFGSYLCRCKAGFTGRNCNSGKVVRSLFNFTTFLQSIYPFRIMNFLQFRITNF